MDADTDQLRFHWDNSKGMYDFSPKNNLLELDIKSKKMQMIWVNTSDPDMNIFFMTNRAQ